MVEDPRGAGRPAPSMQDVIDDLAMRFVVNCPAEEQESFERLLFQVEQAFWFYDDQYREVWPGALPTLTMVTFCQKLFKHCPLLKAFEPRAEEIYQIFRTYKAAIPTCGAMILDTDCKKLLLVKGWKGHTWGFPKGKIDKDEDKPSCATREVLEEVGYDITEKLLPDDYIEHTWQQQTIRLYIVTGVPADTHFMTHTKKEIGDIAWHKLKDLPTNRDDDGLGGKGKPYVLGAPLDLPLPCALP